MPKQAIRTGRSSERKAAEAASQAPTIKASKPSDDGTVTEEFVGFKRPRMTSAQRDMTGDVLEVLYDSGLLEEPEQEEEPVEEEEPEEKPVEELPEE